MSNLNQGSSLQRPLFFFVLLYLAFIGLGLPDTALGVAWVDMRLEFGSPLEAAGVITAVVTLSSAISGYSSAGLLLRFGAGKLTAVSVLLTAIAAIGYAISPSYWFIVALAIPLGLGAGAVDSALNHYVAANLSSKHMNWLHSSWGIGASFSPLILTLGIVHLGSWRFGYGMIGILLLMLSVLLFMTLRYWKENTQEVDKRAAKKKDKPTIKGSVPILSILTFFIYVAIETGIGLWLSALLIESRDVPVSLAGTLVSVYFGCIMIGRFSMGFISEKLGNRLLIKVGIGLSFLGSLLFLNQDHFYLFTVGIVLIGLGFAPLYPSLMHETTARFNRVQAKKIISLQVSFSYISVLTMVPLMGLIASRSTLETIPYMTLFAVVSLALVISALNKKT